MNKILVEGKTPYDVYVERGLLGRAGDIVKPLLTADKILLVSDENVAALYGDKVLCSLKNAYGEGNVFSFFLPAGEQNKTVSNYLEIISEMSRIGLCRNDAAIALGGGVVGDMTGFAAATYMRGIGLVQMPTTLLAMIDSSIGGKTGVDLPEGKNLLGAFYCPTAVLVDPDALSTLDEQQYKNGLGEGIKYAVIDPQVAPFLLENRADSEEFITKCIKLKADIVRKDEFDRGARRQLNLGHTVGHALEAASGYTVAHGVAVATGIKIMTSAARKAGEISSERAEGIFKLLELADIDERGVNAREFLPYIARDKKANGDKLSAVTVTENGVTVREFSKDEFLHYISKTDVKVRFSTLKGSVFARTSKSLAHRIMISAFLAGRSADVGDGDDVEATKRCLSALARAMDEDRDDVVLDVGESASTFRFLLPIACALGRSVRFTGEGRLPSRPIKPLLAALESGGARFERGSEALPLGITRAKLVAGEYRIDGGVSSQFISGLLMALPLLDGDSRLEVTGEAASSSYVELTLRTLESFGIIIRKSGGAYLIKGGQKYAMPSSLPVEGDWSSASFLLTAGALAGEVAVEGVDANSAQGDRRIVDLLKAAGADISQKNGAYISKKSRLRPICFDAADCPDLVPIMATALSFADGVSKISSVARLSQKESDRLAGICRLCELCGARCDYSDGVLTIFGNSRHNPAVFPPFFDHRLAMSAIVASLATEGESLVCGADCISKSYPKFISDMRALGADIEEE